MGCVTGSHVTGRSGCDGHMKEILGTGKPVTDTVVPDIPPSLAPELLG